ncbi:MAG: hypothetical protein E7131_05605 [Rikenellaceae bacterium]|nr:hypothetical protein [Rikenellaceae bacterium]
MNKRFLTQILSLVALAIFGWGCETGHFNEHMIDGYEQETEVTDVQTVEYTLTDGDYSTISKNSTNASIAEQAGEDAVAALSAIGKNKYFGSADEAAAYIPAYLAATYPTLDNGSVAMITYTTAIEMPEDLKKLNAATEYTLTEDDYKTIWESEEDYVKAVTPATASKLAKVIPADDIREGEYVAVTYNYSAEEPKTEEEPETPADPDVPAEKYTSVLGSAVLNDVVEVKGYISATSTQGPILTDKTGSVLLYKTTGFEIGDEVTVSGTISSYNKGFQIGTAGLTIEKTGTTEVKYPQPIELDGPAMDELLTTRTEDGYAQFVKFTGTASAGKYINIKMEGATTAQGSVYGASDEVKALFTDGEECTIYGYFCSISSGEFINVIVVSVDEAPAIEAANNYTSVLGGVKLNDAVEVKGYISATSTQGPILTDNTGSVLLYKTSGYEIGDEVTVSGTISSFNCGFQIGTNGIAIEKTGTAEVKYPAPMDLTGAKMDELLTTRVNDECAYYAKMTGKLSISGNYYNFNVDGATTAVGSLYGVTDEIKAQLADGMSCTLYGYFISISKSGGNPKYVNMIVTKVEPVTKGAATRAIGKVESVKKYAYFKWSGSAFEAADVVAVQPADFDAMGQKYGSFTSPAQDDYLPLFLAQSYPYALDGDVKNVAFRCYAGGTTSWKVDEYVFDGNAWVKTIYFEAKTDQFRKNEGVWAVDRTLELDFTNTSSADTKAFYQYCVNWVYDNKDVAMGAPARDNAGVIISTDIVTIDGAKPAGSYWVSNYGNNEFYTGASAYYGNMDWRPSAVKGGFAAAGMGDLSDDEIVAKLKEHTAEVFAEVLHYVYPTMTPEQYKKVVVKVYAYGPNANYAFSFEVTGEGTFAYIADSIAEL